MYALVNKHGCCAKNPYTNSEKTEYRKYEVFLANVDANNLYGNALRHHLPIGNFHYLEPEEYNHINWKTIKLDTEIGYFVICDLQYPPTVQEKTKNFPLAPEIHQISGHMFTSYMKQMLSRNRLSRNPASINPEGCLPRKKLLTTCWKKIEYGVHFAALQCYLKYGLIIDTIHRVIQFKQDPIFRDFINYNTQRRTVAANDFEKDFYKAKNCCLFGKSLENKHNRCDIKLCNDHTKFRRVASQAKFRCARIFSRDLVAAEMTKANVVLDAPAAIGVTVLDISKVIMYDLAYEQFPRYEELFGCKINIIGGDTDSFFLEVIGVDLYNVLFPLMLTDGLLDSSNYPCNHLLYSSAHKAQLDCIKDEFAGKIYDEFILLRPKSYSMRCVENRRADKRRSKGVPYRNVKRFKHEDYKSVFLTECEITSKCRRMQSELHTIYNIEQIKIALSHADDKRAWLSNNYSVPYGYHLLKNQPFLEDEEEDNETEEPTRTLEMIYEEIMGTKSV